MKDVYVIKRYGPRVGLDDSVIAGDPERNMGNGAVPAWKLTPIDNGIKDIYLGVSKLAEKNGLPDPQNW